MQFYYNLESKKKNVMVRQVSDRHAHSNKES